MTTINVSQRDTARQAWKAIKGIIFFAVAIIVLLILFNLCTFTVGESEQAVVSRFGKMHHVVLDPSLAEKYPEFLNTVTDDGKVIITTTGKGLQFKIPFFDSVTKYDSWLLTYTSQQVQVNTADKNKYMVTMFAQWRVANPALFYLKMQTRDRASQYFDNTIYPILIQRINRLQADDFLSNKDMLNASLEDALKAMNAIVKEAGIVVADVQISRTLLPDANLQSTYQRMVANRQKVAQQFRSEGEELYLNVVADADLEASRLVANATKQSKEIKGKADADALEIYAKAYVKDPEFYGYWRSLQAMKKSLGGSTIVLDRNHPLWKDLLDMIQQGRITTN